MSLLSKSGNPFCIIVWPLGARVGSGEFCISLVQVSSFYHSFERFDLGFLSGFWNVYFIMLFITLLYRDITDDEACVDELRMTFRFFASVLVRRAQKVIYSSVYSSLSHTFCSLNSSNLCQDTLAYIRVLYVI